MQFHALAHVLSCYSPATAVLGLHMCRISVLIVRSYSMYSTVSHRGRQARGVSALSETVTLVERESRNKSSQEA